MERVLTAELPPDTELIAQFEVFVREPKNWKDIERRKRIAIAPNGSIVPEVPKVQRGHILQFCHEHGLQFKSELIATLIDPKRTYELYDRAYKVRLRALSDGERRRKICEMLEEIDYALNKEFPGNDVLLNTGLEVADPHDLKKLHKYTTNLDDYVAYADYLRARNIAVGANVLLGAPMINDPIRKAFATIRFTFEEMRADKVLLITWNPVKHTVGKKLYDRGEIDVLSATQSAEIYRIAKTIYPNKMVEFNPMRSYIYHGKHQNFRGSRVNTDARKLKAREEVGRIASEVFT